VLAGIQESMANDNPYVGVFLRKEEPLISDPAADLNPPELITDLSEIHQFGTFAKIHDLVPIPDAEGAQLMLLAHRRIQIQDLLEIGPPLRVQVQHHELDPFDAKDDKIKAYSNEIITVLRDVMKNNPLFKEHMQYFTQRIDLSDPYKLADFAASVTTSDQHALQDVLEELDVHERLKKALVLLTKERELSKLQQEISQQVNEKISDNQRKFYLQEQLKSIKQELGVEKDDKDSLLNKFRNRLTKEGIVVPTYAMQVS
jgi:Lon-like ATP-dependent protease